ncbi:hypothetical protein BB560_002990 [Smittium megazygosporum]|uniref:Phorbol-ester/DAG-type domain-containing protein n=1 Tax=Smittium megazygosporum TaxID=133381 RepID=A0A2T9ZDA5_9FUNG|nr:hypothetical protein BB560_002990 [Smittium megazygosporum]
MSVITSNKPAKDISISAPVSSARKIPSFSNHAHNFAPHTFNFLTYCSFCKGLLWGLNDQGLVCTCCGYVCHYGCEKNIKAPCLQIENIEMVPLSPDQIYNSRLKRDFLKELDAQKKANRSMRNTIYPEINIITTAPKNFSGFIEKCYPVALAQNFFHDIIFWENPKNTVIAMFVWTILCARPELLVVLPSLILSIYVTYNLIDPKYFAQITEITNSTLNQKNPALSSNSSAGYGFSNPKDDFNEMVQLIDNPQEDSSARSSFWWTIQKYMFRNLSLKPESSRFMDNMRFNQNVTGMYLNVYNSAIEANKYLDWSYDPELTKYILFGLILLTFLETIVIYYIPMSFIVWMGGIIGFLSLNPYIRAFFFVIISPELSRMKESLLDYYNNNNNPQKIEDQDSSLDNSSESHSDSESLGDESSDETVDPQVASFSKELNRKLFNFQSPEAYESEASSASSIFYKAPQSDTLVKKTLEIDIPKKKRYTEFVNNDSTCSTTALDNLSYSAGSSPNGSSPSAIRTLKDLQTTPLFANDETPDISHQKESTPAEAHPLFKCRKRTGKQKLLQTVSHLPDSLIEHERYWVAVGWTRKLYGSDPNVWSDGTEKKDYTDQIAAFERISPIEILKYYHLDLSFNDGLIDRDGWTYFSSTWTNPQQKPGALSYTRCRKYIKNK